MDVVHLVMGVIVLATNLGAGIWGAIAWLRQVPSPGFWYLLRTAQIDKDFYWSLRGTSKGEDRRGVRASLTLTA